MTMYNWDEWARAAALKRGADAELAMLTPSVKDWDAWLAEAKSERLSLAIWNTYKDTQMARMLPDLVAEELQSQTKAAVACGEGLHLALSSAASLLEQEKLPFVLISTATYQDCFYGGEGFIPEFTLLVDPDHLRAATEVLTQDGWVVSDSEDDYAILVSSLSNGQIKVTSTAAAGQSSVISTLPTEVINLEARPFRIPSAAARAVLTAYNAVVQHRLIPAWIVLEVAIAFSRLDRAGWQQAIELASGWDVVEEASAAVDTAKARLGLQLPPGFTSVIEEQRPGWLKRRALEMTLKNPEGSLQSSIGSILGRFLKR